MEATRTYTRYHTDIGPLVIAEDGQAVTHVLFDRTPVPPTWVEQETPLLRKCYEEIQAYLKGNLRTFETPLAPQGTPFQMRVWDALRTIPYGETRSYGQIAAQIGSPKAARAVGLANNRNPISVIVPCHRVIGQNGALVGYGGGLDTKKALLALEKAQCDAAC